MYVANVPLLNHQPMFHLRRTFATLLLKLSINSKFKKSRKSIFKSSRQDAFCKKGVLRKNLQNSQENTSARVSYLIKLRYREMLSFIATKTLKWKFFVSS